MSKHTRGTWSDSEKQSPDPGHSRNGNTGREKTTVLKAAVAAPGSCHTSRESRFQPAFLDTRTNTVHISCFADGRPAPVHLPGNLPKNVQRSNGASQEPPSSGEHVVAGFLRDRKFYTRRQANHHHDNDSTPQRIEKRLLFW